MYDDNDAYKIITKNKNDILNEMEFETEDDKYICESIIANLEKDIADGLKDMKTVQIPFIGSIRINPVKRKLRDAKLHLSDVRKRMSKEEYKDYVRDLVADFKEEQKNIDKEKLIMNKIKSNNKTKYEELYKRLGKSYADMFLYSIRLLKEIPFDEEWENHYQFLKD